MSITHRATGVFLSIAGAPLPLWWIIATAGGPETFATFAGFASSMIGKLAIGVSVLCLFYHLLNGIRHLVWDTGRALEIRSAYTGGWLVLIGTVVVSAVVLGVAL